MKLIKKYVKEVGRNLPLLKGREDIEKELLSTLEDMLEERAQKSGKPANEAMEIELLKEYGSPFDVAMTYNPQPYLIGPRLFPTFLKILKIVLPIVVTVLAILTGIDAFVNQNNTTDIFSHLFGEIFSAVVTAFGMIVLVFAVLERTSPNTTLEELENGKVWEPESLNQEADSETIKRGEIIAEIAFTLLGLAFLNSTYLRPIFGDGFLKMLPWINASFLVEIVLDAYLLRNSVWTVATRLVKIAIEAASIAITFILMRTPNLFVYAEMLKNVPENSSVNLDVLSNILGVSFNIAFLVILIIQGVELAKAIYGLLRINYKTK